MHRFAFPNPFAEAETLDRFACAHAARESPSGESAPTWSRSRRVSPSQNSLFEPRTRIIRKLLAPDEESTGSNFRLQRTLFFLPDRPVHLRVAVKMAPMIEEQSVN